MTTATKDKANKATLYNNNGIIQARYQEPSGKSNKSNKLTYRSIINRVTLKKTSSLNVRTLLDYDRTDKELDSKYDQLSKKIDRKLHHKTNLYTALSGDYFIAFDAVTAQLLFANIQTNKIEIACVKSTKEKNVYNGDAVSVYGKLKEINFIAIDELTRDDVIQIVNHVRGATESEILTLFEQPKLDANPVLEPIESKPKRVSVESSLHVRWELTRETVIETACEFYGISEADVLMLMQNHVKSIPMPVLEQESIEQEPVLETKPKRVSVESSVSVSWGVQQEPVLEQELIDSNDIDVDALFVDGESLDREYGQPIEPVQEPIEPEQEPITYQEKQAEVTYHVKKLGKRYNSAMLVRLRPKIQYEHLPYLEAIISIFDDGYNTDREVFNFTFFDENYSQMFNKDNQETVKQKIQQLKNGNE